MSDATELFTIVHELTIQCDALVVSVEEILELNEGPMVDIPTPLLALLASNLRVQTKLTARLLEEHARIVDLVEKAAQKK